jgi:hypothetical protein
MWDPAQAAYMNSFPDLLVAAVQDAIELIGTKISGCTKTVCRNLSTRDV